MDEQTLPPEAAEEGHEEEREGVAEERALQPVEEEGQPPEEALPSLAGEVVSPPPKRLYRSRRDRVIAGVCGGIGQYFGIDPVIVRALFVFFALITFGVGAVLYLLAVFVVPENMEEEPAAVRRLTMQSNVFWGGLLVLAGVYFLVRIFWDRFMPGWIWDSIRAGAIAIVLVGAGVLLILNVSRRPSGEKRRLTRAREGRMVAGVCSGLGRYLGVDATWVRLLWIIFSLFAAGSVFFSVGIGAVVYVVAMLAIPEEEATG